MEGGRGRRKGAKYVARERVERVREGDDAERNIGGWLWWIC